MAKRRKGKRPNKPRPRELHPKHGGHGSAKFGPIDDAPLHERVARRTYGRRVHPVHRERVEGKKVL